MRTYKFTFNDIELAEIEAENLTEAIREWVEVYSEMRLDHDDISVSSVADLGQLVITEQH